MFKDGTNERIDENITNNYGDKVDFDEYEDKAAIAQFENETVKNIMTASSEQVHACAKKLGINIEFVNSVPGKNPNADGAYDPKTNTLYINKNTKYPMQQVFLHELTHFFESADNYSEFQNTVFKSRAFKKWLEKYTDLKNDKYKSIDEYRNALKERYGENDDTKINREMVAFFVSDNLFQKDFGDLGRLATELTGSKKERFISFVKNIFRRFKNAVSGIDKLEKKFLSLYRTAGQNKNTDSNNGVKYSLNENFNAEYDNWDKKNPRKTFNIGTTSKVLQGLNIPYKEITWDSSKIIKIKSKHPEMTDAIIKQVPQIIENPIIVMQSKTKESRITMFGEVYANNKPILVVLELNPNGRNGLQLDELKIASAYGKDNSQMFIDSSDILYVDNNKKRVSNWEKRTGLQLPVGYSVTNSNTNISQKSNGVNSSISENAENDTDIRYMLSEDTDNEIIDRYTEKQYNNFGWIAVNQVLTKNEWSQYNNKLRETLSSKIPRNINGEHVMTVGEHSSDITALVYVKGTAGNPIVTKVVRVNKNISNTENISVILEELADYERQGYREPYAIIENYARQKVFSRYTSQDFINYRELKKRKLRNNSQRMYSDSGTGENRTRSAETNSADSKAGLNNNSAFSIDEDTDIRYMLSEEDKFDKFGNYFDEDENGEVTFMSADEYQNELKKNLKLGVLDKQQIELKSKALLKTYQSRMDSADVASQLLSIYNDIKNIDENGNHAKPKVEKLASEIYDNIVSKVSNGEVYDQLTDIIKGNKMIWDESVKSAFGDDWNSFIRKNRHKLNLIKADSGIDKLEKKFLSLYRTAGQNKNTRPNSDSTDVIFLDSNDVSYSLNVDNNSSIKEQIKQNIDTFNNMSAVANVTTPEKFNSIKEAKQWVLSTLQKTGFKVDRQNLGTILFDEKRINTSLNYIKEAEGISAFAALPQVLKRGVQIDEHTNHKGREYGTITIGAPVILNGQRGNMAVVVKQTNRNYYKTHKLLMPDGSQFVFNEKNSAEPSGATPKIGAHATTTDTVSNTNISQKSNGVNSSISENAENDTDIQQMYTGEKSQTADKLKLETAKEMGNDGVESETIRKETGWFKGKDGLWRFEIDDSKMKINSTDTDKPVLLKNLISHRELFKAYPELKNVSVEFVNSQSYRGKSVFEDNKIFINKRIVNDIFQYRKTLIHELQHFVQYRELFASGGSVKLGTAYLFNVLYDKYKNTEHFKNLITSDEKGEFIFSKATTTYMQNEAKDFYKSLYGEVEARDTSERIDLTEKQRKNTKPVNDGIIIDINLIQKQLIDNLYEIGYTKNEIKDKFGDIGYDKSRNDENIEEGSLRNFSQRRWQRENNRSISTVGSAKTGESFGRASGAVGRGISGQSRGTLLKTKTENTDTQAGLNKSAFSFGSEYDKAIAKFDLNDISADIYNSIVRNRELRNSPAKSNQQMAVEAYMKSWDKKNGFDKMFKDGTNERIDGEINTQKNIADLGDINSQSNPNNMVEEEINSMLENQTYDIENPENSDIIDMYRGKGIEVTSDSDISPKTIKQIEKATKKVTSNFKTLENYSEPIIFGDVKNGIAENSYNPRTGLNTITLRKADFANPDLLLKKLNDDFVSGISYETDTIQSLVAHEMGHNAHIALALKRANLPYGRPLTAEQYGIFENEYSKIRQEIYISVFSDESLLEIKNLCINELGGITENNANELIAQSFGNYYYGKNKSKIAEEVVKFFKKGLK